MGTRFKHLDDAYKAIARKEEMIYDLLNSETAYEILRVSSFRRSQEIINLRKALITKRMHYLECEEIIIDLM